MANRNFYASAQPRREQGGRDAAGKNAPTNATADNGKTRLRGINGDSQSPVFEDPRSKHDRRQMVSEEGLPASGCRRHGERRSDRINLGVWWMKRNYCVDLVAPRRKAVSKPTFNRGAGKYGGGDPA
ncbi:MAG: hypothetical protein HKO71_06560 [Pseudomonadales bacterium]|nr:hypothetical protein [Pseudomonadales bacterium]